MSRAFLKRCFFVLILKNVCDIILKGDFVNVYDFDNTIYKGESTFDYYLFCVKHHPRLVRFIFIVLLSLVKYKMCLISEKGLMELCTTYVHDFLAECPDALELAEKFWDMRQDRIKDFYFDIKNEEDVILSASFGFMLRPVAKRLGIKNLVCSEVNLDTGEIQRLCFRKNKKKLFCDLIGTSIDDFYTDSLNDVEMLRFAKNGYIVKGNRISKWSEK